MVTFDVNPRQVLSRFPPQLITTLEEKVAVLEMLGLDHLFLLSFSLVMSLEPAEFLEMLVRHIPIKLFVVGDDFRFGKKRLGDVSFLRQWCNERNIAVKVTEAQCTESMRISSSVIRKLIFKGDLEEVAQVLSAPYTLCGTAAALSRSALSTVPGIFITIPVPCKIIPQDGVYVALLQRGESFQQRALVHIGTSGEGRRHIEAFLYGEVSGPIEGEFVSLFLFRRIRDNIAFEHDYAPSPHLAEDIAFSEYFWRHTAVPPLPRIRLLSGEITDTTRA